MTCDPLPDTMPADSATTLDAGEPAIKPFAFPFSPQSYAPAKGDAQPWHQKGNKSAHEKRIGHAPPGTRRSMGKR